MLRPSFHDQPWPVTLKELLWLKQIPLLQLMSGCRNTLKQDPLVLLIHPSIVNLHSIDLNLPTSHQIKADPQFQDSLLRQVVKVNGKGLPLPGDDLRLIFRCEGPDVRELVIIPIRAFGFERQTEGGLIFWGFRPQPHHQRKASRLR